MGRDRKSGNHAGLEWYTARRRRKNRQRNSPSVELTPSALKGVMACCCIGGDDMTLRSKGVVLLTPSKKRFDNIF